MISSQGLTASADFIDLDAGIRGFLSVESLPADFFVFSPEDYELPLRESPWLTFSEWIIQQQDTHSDVVQAFGAWADQTLSGDPRILPQNRSYVRLAASSTSETSDLFQFKPQVRFRLDLPTTQERFRLVLESESEELTSVDEQRQERQRTRRDEEESRVTTALRYLYELGDMVNLSADVGVRVKANPDAFVRLRGVALRQLDDNWNLVLDQRLYYFFVRGFGTRSYAAVSRPIGSGWRYTADATARWIHPERTFELGHGHRFYKRLNHRAELSPRLGVQGTSRPNWQPTLYFTDVTYRYRLYDNWLFGEVTPTLEFPREDNFKDRYAITLRIEMFFSGEVR